jgi:hypothetical protein
MLQYAAGLYPYLQDFPPRSYTTSSDDDSHANSPTGARAPGLRRYSQEFQPFFAPVPAARWPNSDVAQSYGPAQYPWAEGLQPFVARSPNPPHWPDGEVAQPLSTSDQPARYRWAGGLQPYLVPTPPTAPVGSDPGPPGFLQKASEPITNYPATYATANREAREQMARGWDQLSASPPTDQTEDEDQAQLIADRDLLNRAKGIANIGLGAFGYTLSPIHAAVQSIIGQPIEDATGVSKEYTDFGTELLIPGLGFTKLRGAPAEVALRPPTTTTKTIDGAAPIGAASGISDTIESYHGWPMWVDRPQPDFGVTQRPPVEAPATPTLPAGESGLTKDLAGARNAIEGSTRDAAAPGISGTAQATFGRAKTTDYTKTFYDTHPELEGKNVVHHAVEKQVLKKYPAVVTDAEIHSLENLRGIPKELNSKLHLSQIRIEWNRFYDRFDKSGTAPTQSQLLQKATEIDTKYGSQFRPRIGE